MCGAQHLCQNKDRVMISLGDLNGNVEFYPCVVFSVYTTVLATEQAYQQHYNTITKIYMHSKTVYRSKSNCREKDVYKPFKNITPFCPLLH